MKIAEITVVKPLTPEKARIEALKKQKERTADALKAERDRQKVQKAQKQIAQIRLPTSASITQ